MNSRQVKLKPTAHNSSLNQINPIVLLTVIFLFIVLILHHGNYTYDFLDPLRDFQINKPLQKFSVGGFLFLSGFKLVKSKLSVPVWDFWVNRFSRVYLPYLLAVIIFSFVVYPIGNNSNFPSTPNFLIHILCLQALLPNFFQPNYTTIWFVSILFCCYAFFLSTRRLLVRIFDFCLVLLLTIISISWLRLLVSRWDIAIFQGDFEIYLLFFALGMVYAQTENLFEKTKIKILLFIAIVGALNSIIYYNFISLSWNIFPWEVITIISTSVPLYLVGFKIAPRLSCNHQTLTLMNLVAYSSFCTFLFHRPIWTMLRWLWYQKSLPQAAFIVMLGIPLILFISYWLQTLYDRIRSRLSNFRRVI